MEGKAMSEQTTAPYASQNRRRVRIPQIHQMKARGQKWAMLTAYDMYTAAIFEDG
jgi:3-methyl-2-oxobutanoate hydroxymethyltransferase